MYPAAIRCQERDRSSMCWLGSSLQLSADCRSVPETSRNVRERISLPPCVPDPSAKAFFPIAFVAPDTALARGRANNRDSVSTLGRELKRPGAVPKRFSEERVLFVKKHIAFLSLLC